MKFDDVYLNFNSDPNLCNNYEKIYVINYWKDRAKDEGLPWDEIKDLVGSFYSEFISGAADWFENGLDDDNFLHNFLDSSFIYTIDDFLFDYADLTNPPMRTYRDLVNAYRSDEGYYLFDEKFIYFDYNDKYVLLGSV